MTEAVTKAFETLKRGGLILYPTDTIWGIGCDATNAEAVQRVYDLKKRTEDKTLVTLVSDFRMLNHYVEEIPEVAYDILKYASKPTTIIYDDPIRVAENLIAADNSLAIRVVRNTFCNSLLKKLKRPIVSTSANLHGAPTPKKFTDIHQVIKDGVDYIVPLDQTNKTANPSSIIKLTKNGQVTVIRE